MFYRLGVALTRIWKELCIWMAPACLLCIVVRAEREEKTVAQGEITLSVTLCNTTNIDLLVFLEHMRYLQLYREP